MRVGPRVGPRGGPLVGPHEGGSDGVPFDAAMGRYAPTTAAHWAAILATAGVASQPTSSYAFTEGSGDLNDQIGAVTFTSNGTPNYQQSITGSSRPCVTFDDGGTDYFNCAIPNANVSSALVIAYVALTGAAGGTRNILQHPNIFAEAIATGKLRADGGSMVDSTANLGTTWHAIVLRSNVTATTQAIIYEEEVLAPSWFADSPGTLILGGASASAAGMAVNLLARWEGAAAELSNAQVKSILQALGWTVAW